MTRFRSTRQVAILLGMKPGALTKAIWDGRVEPPAKSPSGNYLWRLADIERASWALLHRAFKPAEDKRHLS